MACEGDYRNGIRVTGSAEVNPFGHVTLWQDLAAWGGNPDFEGVSH